jgi:hypothetical protein
MVSITTPSRLTTTRSTSAPTFHARRPSRTVQASTDDPLAVTMRPSTTPIVGRSNPSMSASGGSAPGHGTSVRHTTRPVPGSSRYRYALRCVGPQWSMV